jgi:RNA polymerase sigma-70 factor (ECF subfamily)
MTTPPDQLRELVLVLRCQAADPDAFAEIVNRYGPRLRYYLLKLLGHPEAAVDASQEVWLDVYRGIARLRRPESFRTWLYRVARDRAARVLRQSRSRPRTVGDDQLADAEVVEDFTAEDAARIHSALDRLSAEHREVLVLRFMDDLSYEEISQVIGCHLGTVKSRIHHAKRLLRRAMEELGDHE